MGKIASSPNHIQKRVHNFTFDCAKRVINFDHATGMFFLLFFICHNANRFPLKSDKLLLSNEAAFDPIDKSSCIKESWHIHVVVF